MDINTKIIIELLEEVQRREKAIELEEDAIENIYITALIH
jgi:hypothetical protein